MHMENDNGLAGNVVVTAEQATKINDTDGRLPENRQSGVVLDAGTGSERGEQGDETAVAVAVAVEENRSNLVGELPPRSSSARVPFTNLSQIDADLALARTLQEQRISSSISCIHSRSSVPSIDAIERYRKYDKHKKKLKRKRISFQKKRHIVSDKDFGRYGQSMLHSSSFPLALKVKKPFAPI